MNMIKNCNNTRKLCIDNNCDICFSKSFKSLNLNNKFELVDNNINLRKISKFSSIKTEFKCNQCFHLFYATFANISNNRGCPYCAIPSRKLCENIECNKCFNRSFASHEKSIYWN